MPRLTTDAMPLVTGQTALWNPMTEPMPTLIVRYVRTRMWFAAVPDPSGISITVQPGVQFSDDGIDWSASPVNIGNSFTATDGWDFTSHDTYTDMDADITTGKKLYVRFGVKLTHNVADTPLNLLARMRLETRTTRMQTITAGPQLLFTQGSDSVRVFHPMTPWVPAECVQHSWGAFEIDSINGPINVVLMYQVCDEPNDPGDWAAATENSDPLTADGVHYPSGTSNNLTLNRDYIRFGLGAKNGSGDTHIAACRGRLRWDFRDS